mmetsp:Transcript_12563/g.41136  ORF Transcript_12563/g.41136 Transcript_12563/m.41136 type:complete len:236 (-) Transcript_12563:1103-1810(-)
MPGVPSADLRELRRVKALPRRPLDLLVPHGSLGGPRRAGPPSRRPGVVFEDGHDPPVRSLAQVLRQLQSSALQPRRALRPADFDVDTGHEDRRRRVDDEAARQPREGRRRSSHEPRRRPIRASLSVPAAFARLRPRPPGRGERLLHVLPRHPHHPRPRPGVLEAPDLGLLRPVQLVRNSRLARRSVVQQPLPLLHGLRRSRHFQRQTQPAGQTPRHRTPHVARHRTVAPPLRPQL